VHYWSRAPGGVPPAFQHQWSHSLLMLCGAWHLGDKVPCVALMPQVEAPGSALIVGHRSNFDQVCAVERSILCDRAPPACLGSWMRGLCRAYDPHRAVRHWRQLLSSCLVRVWGSPPPFGAGLSEESTLPSGSCLGRPMGTYPPFIGGAKLRVTRESGFGWERPWVWIVRAGGGSRRGPGLVWGGA
jgi:hypothetical protein